MPLPWDQRDNNLCLGQHLSSNFCKTYLYVTQTAQLQQGIILQMLFKVLNLLEKPVSRGLYGLPWFEILKDM